MVHAEDVTQHRQAGLALMESEEHFRLLTKLSPFPLCVTDGTAVMEYVNDRFTSVFGYRLEDIPTGEKWFQMAYPDEKYREAVRASWNEAMQKSKSTGKPFEPQEYWVTCKDGSLCIVEVSTTSIGKKSLVVFSDVTQHRRIEDELRKSDDFNKNLLSNAPNPVLVTNPDTSIRYINPAFETLTGFSREELIGCRSPYPWWPKDDFRRLETANTEGRKKDLNILERHYINKDGQMFWVTVGIKPVKFDGEVEYYLSNWVDITERKQAEEALKESEGRLRATVTNAPIGISTADADKRFTSANEAFCRVLGYTEDELRKLTFKDITHPDDVKESHVLMQALDSGKISFFSLEKRYLKKDGKVIFGRVTVSELHDQEQIPKMYIAELEDITERKQAEQALRRSEEKSRLIFESVAEGIAVVDLQGIIGEVNQRMLDMHGLASKNEMVGKPALEFIDRRMTAQKSLQGMHEMMAVRDSPKD